MQRASFALPACASLEPWFPSSEAPSSVERQEPWNDHYQAEDPGSFLWRMTEECLDDLGAAWFSMLPRENDTWRSATNAEKRLLAQLDGVVCFGPEIEGRLKDSLPDFDTPAQMFAVTMVAGCIDSPGAESFLDAIWAMALEKDDEVVAAITDALCRASQPKIVPLARARLAHPDPRIRASAVTVLNSKNEACTNDVLGLFGDPAPQVLCAVAEAWLHPAVPAQWESSVTDLLRHEDERVVAAALKTCVAKRLGAGRSRALQICGEGRFAFAGAALMLALYGDERDTNSFALWARGEGDAHLVRAMGYFGAADLVPSLIFHLSNDTTKSVAAEALVRMTGASLIESVSVPLYGEDEQAFVDNPSAAKEVSRALTDPKKWGSPHGIVGA